MKVSLPIPVFAIGKGAADSVKNAAPMLVESLEIHLVGFVLGQSAEIIKDCARNKGTERLAFEFHFDWHAIPHCHHRRAPYQIWPGPDKSNPGTMFIRSAEKFDAYVLECPPGVGDGSRICRTSFPFDIAHGGQCDAGGLCQIVLRPVHEAARCPDLRRNNSFAHRPVLVISA